MTDEEMAEEYVDLSGNRNYTERAFKDGAEFGYNKGKAEAKEIIKGLFESCFGYNSKTVNYEIKARAEKFLKESCETNADSHHDELKVPVNTTKKQYIAIQLYPKTKNYVFESIQEAAKFTGVPQKHISQCIKTGHKYRMWCFDEA